MQVSDSQAAAPASVASKEEVRSVADEAADRARDAVGAGLSRHARTQAWRRDRRGARRSPRRRQWPDGSVPSRCPGTRPRRRRPGGRRGRCARCRSGADGLRARRCAGAHSHRRGRARRDGDPARPARRPARTVEAQLLTHAASSRQTLSVVMDEIRSRLRDRGIVLSASAAGGAVDARTSRGRRRRRRRGRPRAGGAGGVEPLNATPFDLGACPRVRARQARATRAALRPAPCCPSGMVGGAAAARSGDDDGSRASMRTGPAATASSSRSASVRRAVASVVEAVFAGAAGRLGAGRRRGVLGGACARARPSGGVLAACSRPAFDRIGGGVHVGPRAAVGEAGSRRRRVISSVRDSGRPAAGCG